MEAQTPWRSCWTCGKPQNAAAAKPTVEYRGQESPVACETMRVKLNYLVPCLSFWMVRNHRGQADVIVKFVSPRRIFTLNGKPGFP